MNVERPTPEAEATPDATTPAPVPAPTPPPGAPVTAYAGILDGEHLWLAVEATAGTLALRDVASGDVHGLAGDLAEDDLAHRSVRVDLTTLPGDGPATYDAVLVPTGGGSPTPVWTPPLVTDTPVTTPPTRDGRWQLDVARADDGTLQVTRRPLGPSAELLAVSVTEDGIELVLGGVPAAGELMLLARKGGVRAAYPLQAAGDRVRAVLTVAGLPEGGPRFATVAVGTPGAAVPVRRRHNGLADPNPAVVLPELFGDDPERPRLRLRYAPDGRLTVRLPDPHAGRADEGDDQADDRADDQADDQTQPGDPA